MKNQKICGLQRLSKEYQFQLVIVHQKDLQKGHTTFTPLPYIKNFQGSGIGKKMMSFIEDKLKGEGNRILIVETSGKAEYELTRAFYVKCNYIKQATIPEFYAEGDDKIVFWKKLI